MAESFEISQVVKSALSRNIPVVALESSVIAQGLPGGKGVEAAVRMCRKIEAEDCVPAVIGVIEGKIKIGLTEDEMLRLAKGDNVIKASTRELPLTVVRKLDAATTVAATANLAVSAGIPVMATGGIGGVHRGASQSWDISADLWELTKIPALVVCSGAKSVLDLCATLEWMETHQIAVYGYRTEEFPAFYSPKSGLKVPKLDGPEDVSEFFKTRLGLGMRNGMVLGVPILAENAIEVNDAIEKAVTEAKEQGIHGPELTPWLLAKVQELSDGKAIDANIALLENNAEVAAQVAAALCGRKDKRIGFH